MQAAATQRERMRTVPGSGAPATRPVRFGPLQALYQRLGPPVAFHYNLGRLTGSVKAGLMLSQALYWTARGSDIVRRDGWFYKTQRDWQHETGMSRTEQETARRILRSMGLVEERHEGMPRRTWFRMNLAALGTQLSRLDVDAPVPDRVRGITMAPQLSLGALRSNEQWVRQLLGPVQWFHREFATVTQSVTAALFLSCALTQFFRLARRQDTVPGMTLTQPQWARLSGMDRTQLQNARRTLRDLKLTAEFRSGLPPVVTLLLDLDRLMAALREPSSAPVLQAAAVRRRQQASQSAANRNADCRIPASSLPEIGIQYAGSVQISLRQACKSPGGNTANQYGQNMRILYRRLTTCTGLQQPVCAPACAPASAAPSTPGSSRWIMPSFDNDADGLLAQSALTVIARSSIDDATRQLVLDELAGAMRMLRGGVRNPVAFLRALVNAAVRGEFVPAYASQVRAGRETRQRIEAARIAHERAHASAVKASAAANAAGVAPPDAGAKEACLGAIRTLVGIRRTT